MIRRKKSLILITGLITGLAFFLFSCLGVGQRLVIQEPLLSIPYDRAFDLALQSAEQMHNECRKINPFNYPTIVLLGTSKSRGVITIFYKFDPEAGSIGKEPPMSISSVFERVFVPHFAAEFYMHIRFLKEGDMARGVQVEVMQSKGIKKQIFQEEMENLRKTYFSYLKRYWK